LNSSEIIPAAQKSQLRCEKEDDMMPVSARWRFSKAVGEWPMEISTVEMKRCTVIRLSGRFDSTVTPELDAELDRLLAANHFKLALNMAEVTYISSAALRTLMRTWKECRRYHRGDLHLAEVRPEVDRVLEFVGLRPSLTIYASEAEAVGSF
jgi:anti-sigma B factor antagonist